MDLDQLEALRVSNYIDRDGKEIELENHNIEFRNASFGYDLRIYKPDIVPERLAYNVHYKSPTGSYAEMFQQMKADGIISTRGLKDDARI